MCTEYSHCRQNDAGVFVCDKDLPDYVNTYYSEIGMKLAAVFVNVVMPEALVEMDVYLTRPRLKLGILDLGQIVKLVRKIKVNKSSCVSNIKSTLIFYYTSLLFWRTLSMAQS